MNRKWDGRDDQSCSFALHRSGDNNGTFHLSCCKPCATPNSITTSFFVGLPLTIVGAKETPMTTPKARVFDKASMRDKTDDDQSDIPFLDNGFQRSFPVSCIRFPHTYNLVLCFTCYRFLPIASICHCLTLLISPFLFPAFLSSLSLSILLRFSLNSFSFSLVPFHFKIQWMNILGEMIFPWSKTPGFMTSFVVTGSFSASTKET